MSAMLSAASKKKSYSTRCPSLMASYGEHMNLEKHFNQEAKEFDSWMTIPINSERGVPAHKDTIKALAVTKNVLVHAGFFQAWGPDMTFEWLLQPNDHFDTIFAKYCEYRSKVCHDDASYIAKQLTDLRWPVIWATLRKWRWGYLYQNRADELLTRLQNLERQYRNKANTGVKRAREIDDMNGEQPNIPKLDIKTFKENTKQAENKAMVTINAIHHHDEITNEERLFVTNVLMWKIASRGGRSIDLHRVKLGVSSHVAWNDTETRSNWLNSQEFDRDDSILCLNSDQQWQLVVLDSKGHLLRNDASDLADLLELYLRCFPDLDFGDLLFTPRMHGARSSRHHVQDYFDTAGVFSDFFARSTETHMGVAMRPYDLRRANASKLASTNASTEVKKSFSSLLGTGIRNLETVYDNRTELDKSFMASQIQKHEFNPAFNEASQNRILLAAFPPTLSVVIARLIRQDSDGTELFALFQKTSEDDAFIELSTQFMQTDQANEFRTGKIALDPTSHKQIWRQESKGILSAEAFFNSKGIGADFALKAMIDGISPVRAKDMIYLPDECAIAEVIEVNEEASQLKVLVAEELPNHPSKSTMQAFYKFTEGSKLMDVELSEIIFPIDLTFNAQEGHFALKKSANLQSV